MNKVLEERLERIKLAIEKGISGNPETGEIFGVRGGVVTNKNKYGYIGVGVYIDKKVKFIRAHQIIWYLANGVVVENIDHINGIKTDNRIENLRSVTQQQNQFNLTKAKGYYWSKATNKWYAKIQVGGKKIHLGTFTNEDDARQAYLDAKEKYHII